MLDRWGTSIVIETVLGNCQYRLVSDFRRVFEKRRNDRTHESTALRLVRLERDAFPKRSTTESQLAILGSRHEGRGYCRCIYRNLSRQRASRSDHTGIGWGSSSKGYRKCRRRKTKDAKIAKTALGEIEKSVGVAEANAYAGMCAAPPREETEKVFDALLEPTWKLIR